MNLMLPTKPTNSVNNNGERSESLKSKNGFAMDARFFAIVATVLIAAAMRLIPHPPNFSPIAAMALFGGAYFAHRTLQDKFLAVVLPLAALFLSDLVIGFHDQMIPVYMSFVLVAFIGFSIGSRRNVLRVAASSVGGSVLFFVITNLSVWASGGWYPRTAEGLVACFVAALPFFQNSLAGDLFFTGLLFSAWALLEAKVPVLRPAYR